MDGSHDETGRSTRVRCSRGRAHRHRGRRLSAQGLTALAAASVRRKGRVIEVVDPRGAAMGAESHVRQDRAPDLVTALRRAVALLRAVDHDHPRGPWRSADPEPTGPSEDPDTRPRSGVDDVPRARNPTARATHNAWSGEHAADPLAAFEYRDGAH